MPESSNPEDIPEGKEVEANAADLDGDVTKPVVKGSVPYPGSGEPALEVEKGGLFKKEIIVPADRVEGEDDGRVVIQLCEHEAERLSPWGTSVLPPRETARRDFLSGVTPDVRSVNPEPITLGAALRALGPGIVSGASDNDPTTVGTLAVVGAQSGFGLCWVLLLVLPMMASVQTIASTVGVTSGKDLQSLIREHFGPAGTWSALVFLVGVNVVTLAADLEGGAAALGLLTHINWRWFPLPLALAVAGLLLLGNYEWVRRILSCVLFVFLLYVPAAFLAHPDWASVLRHTFVPRFSFQRDVVAGTLALLGTTLTSYVYYWQTIEEREANRRRPRFLAQLDAASGMVVATFVFWFILVSTGATLGVHHQQVQTAQDAASALKPIAGPLAQYLFAAGLLASALLALPVLAGTTAYAVGESLGWPVGLSLQPWRSQGFYLVLIAALLLVVPLTLLGVQPVTLLFVAGIIGGIGTPLLLVFLLVIAGNRTVMRDAPIGRGLKVLGWATAAIVTLATAAYLLSQFL
jgi:Mn2+/Fe2+ NRAMP family transporter